MDKLKLTYESQDDIPDGFTELYEEKDGVWTLTGVEGLKTNDDVERIQAALRKEKNDHKDTKEKLRTYGDVTPEDIEALQQERDDLAAQVESTGGDPKKVEEQTRQLVELRRENATMKRDLEKQTTRTAELEEQAQTATGKLSEYQIDTAVLQAMREAKVIPEAQEDALLLARNIFHIDEAGKVAVKDEVGYTPGAEAKDWFMEIKERRPHWWGANKGAGAQGGNGGAPDGNNPFRKESFNMTQIGNIWKTDTARAKRLFEAAKAAGDLHERAVLPS